MSDTKTYCPFCNTQVPAEASPLKASDYEFCPKCLGSYSFAKPIPRSDKPDDLTPSFTGNKYHRVIHGLAAHGGGSVTIDVYSVLTAFTVTSPPIQHAIKKLLCCGIRGKGDYLTEARDAIERAIEDARRGGAKHRGVW